MPPSFPDLRTPLRARALPGLLAAALLAGAGAGATPAAAQSAPTTAAAVAPAANSAAPSPGRSSAASIGERAAGIADGVVARWEAIQDEQGRFPDPEAGYGSDYGTPMLGLAIVRRGVVTGDRVRVAAGLRAVMRPVATPTGGSFELLALARAYRFGAANLATTRQFSDLWHRHEPALRNHLATHGPVAGTANSAACVADPGCYNNLKLVTALATRELAATGIGAATPTALLADSVSHQVMIDELLTETVPKVTGGSVVRTGRAPARGGGILSDPPNNPLAYHALSVAALGELLGQLGDTAPRAATRAFDRATRGLLALTAPDGDLSYYGRGQGQVWVPAAVAEAAAVAAHRTRSRTERRRLLAIADAALERLATFYPAGPAGMPLVPGAFTAQQLGDRGIDEYAAARSYNGLAVDALDRTAALLATVPPATDRRAGAPAGSETATTVPSRRTGVVVSPRQAGIITLTRGPLWVALTARTGPSDDARYGSGLLAIQHRSTRHGWVPVLASAPFGATPVPTLAVRDGNALRVPHATRLHAGRNAALAIGRWSRPGQRGWDPGTAWIWRMVGNSTVEVAFTAGRDLRVVAGALAGEADQINRVRGGITITRRAGARQIRFRTVYRVTVDGRAPRRITRQNVAAGASAYDAALRHARLEFRVRRGARVIVRIRVAAPASG